jgi:hypothetical protein
MSFRGAQGKKAIFLSRPRRFGKTLLLFTLEELFSGNRESFKGLWIDQSDYAFPRLPVLFLSLSMMSTTPEILEDNLITSLQFIAQTANLKDKLIGKTSDMRFESLILALSKESNLKKPNVSTRIRFTFITGITKVRPDLHGLGAQPPP